MKKQIRLTNFIAVFFVFSAFICSGCAEPGSSPTCQTLSEEAPETGQSQASNPVSEIPDDNSGQSASETPPLSTGTRDNTPLVLTPVASGEITYGNDYITLDVSHSDQGYVCICYQGENPKVKLQIIGPSQVTYTYNLKSSSFETFPLTSGNGVYSIGIFENISGTQYATAFYQEFDVSIQDEFSPFLYPNQYVNFTENSDVVAKARELACSADSDLDVISNIFNFVISSITYDYEKAENIASGYICDVDETLKTQTGICLDYAALMASMLRSQGIPTHLEVGYVQDAYHAWISTYVDEKGWINGIIEFDGTSWSLMDPTFTANSSEKALKKFIGEGNNYTVKYVY